MSHRGIWRKLGQGRKKNLISAKAQRWKRAVPGSEDSKEAAVAGAAREGDGGERKS